jgi:hypothetical protein
MKNTANQIILIILTTFFVTNLALSQTIKKDGKNVKLDTETEKKISTLIDSLTGTWHLDKTIRYENGDTIVQEASIQLWLTPKAKPSTTIIFGTAKNFTIQQDCMKCPYLIWKGMYEIEIRTLKGHCVFYLNFIDDRQKNRKKKKEISLTYEFNGHLTNFENGELRLIDKEETVWIYSR